MSKSRLARIGQVLLCLLFLVVLVILAATVGMESAHEGESSQAGRPLQ